MTHYRDRLLAGDFEPKSTPTEATATTGRRSRRVVIDEQPQPQPEPQPDPQPEPQPHPDGGEE